MLEKILTNSKNVNFSDMVGIVEAFGFSLARINGSHHIFKHDSVSEIINLQNVNGQAKPYQIKQFIDIIEKYNLRFKED